MDEAEKQKYYAAYKQAKEQGEPFFPDAVFKDAAVSLLIFLALVALAYFLGAPLEARADPADTSYTPRPEWYFLFLFQLFKYFSGELEVVGVVVLPTLAVILLFLLPFLDRSPRRHFTARPVIIGGTSLMVLAIGVLSYLSYKEAPPPAEAIEGDPTAALYIKNCAGCHGPTIAVPSGANLHEVIAQGKHEGMPAWSADLSSDQIDALVGFILSPAGSQLFTQNCGACHETSELVASDPLELKNSLEQGQDFPGHSDQDTPDWNQTLSQEERIALVNFLFAPDGQRLFVINCASCHGRAVSISGDESQLIEIISQGGLHLEMPSWQQTFSPFQLDMLARYVVDPASVPDVQALFTQHCSSCHGERIPRAEEFYAARRIIASGGSHETMPVWGDILTPEQLQALVSYTLASAKGTSLEIGQEVYTKNCALCHGDFGEGGPNPARQGDIIAPISTSEYLKTRDDSTLRAIIAQGQPNFGMSPFGSAFGGPLSDEEIDAVVAYLRSWEENPPVELPPEIAAIPLAFSGTEIYRELCAQCHGPEGEGGVGPSLNDARYKTDSAEAELFQSINAGHAATAMIGWGEILTADQIQQLVNFIRTLQPEGAPTGPISFARDVFPLLEAKCNICHGDLGGWSGETYDSVLNSGDHRPVVLPGNPEGSLLAQKLLGTHTEGDIMPPGGKLPDAEIQIIIEWIRAGALDD